MKTKRTFDILEVLFCFRKYRLHHFVQIARNFKMALDGIVVTSGDVTFVTGFTNVGREIELI
jgi:hypothetical protein